MNNWLWVNVSRPMAFQHHPYYDLPNDELYEIKNLGIVCRSIMGADGYLEYEPVTLTMRCCVSFLIPELTRDSLDMPGVKFHWYDLSVVSSHVLDSLKLQMKQSEEINRYLRGLENKTSWV